MVFRLAPSPLARACCPSYPQRRTIWLSSTILSTSPSSLLDHLQRSPLPSSAHSTPPSLTLFALSKNVPSELIDLIRAALSTAVPSLGCLSELLPPSIVHHLSPSFATSVGSSETYSLSLATFYPTGNSKAIPFQSTLTGRPNISLGREIKQPQVGEEEVDVGFEAFLSGKKWGFGDGVNLKEGRRAVIEELKGVAPNDVKQMIFFTADRIQPFLGALATYPSSANIGLVASSTPFHSPSHAPFTLFYGDQLASTGAAGVAIVDATPSSPVAIDYAGFEAFGSPMEVTSSKGNIVLTLSTQNAARLLLNAVQALPKPKRAEGSSVDRMDEKDKEFFAAVFESTPELPLDLKKARHVSKIMAGDPSRGAMSVETEEEVKQGYWIVFLHRTLSTPPVTRLLVPSPPSNSFTFLSVASSDSPPRSVHETLTGGSVAVLDAFVAASENGVVVSKIGCESWVCSTEGVAERWDDRL